MQRMQSFKGGPSFTGSAVRALTIVTLVLLGVGCASTDEEQNYRELEPEPQPIQPEEEDPMFGGEEPGRVESVQRPEQPTAPDESEAATTAEANGGSQAAGQEVERSAEPVADQAVAEDASRLGLQPVEGASRAEWATTVVHPVDGSVTHGPIYFTTPADDDLPTPLAREDLEQRYSLAMRLDEQGTLSTDNLGRLATEPVRFYVDALLLPVRLIVSPPFSEQTSP